MSINVVLQTLDGTRADQVLDTYYELAKVWPIGDGAFPLLQYIDPYGDTIFNGQQMSELQKELEILVDKVSTEQQRTILLSIIELASKCKGRPHWFLRFVGD